ncbi:hypothetical protein H1R82_10530 [Thermoactinomyces intermedius]|jgi:hypothetical protein|uniref:Uncharacterized protein n=1 Tax=Thermoactinomyces intermedius TaxID=2024 RepID=A0A8I1ADD0_THEIN|nr:hypothetical protein [Thermoactinomyces intermedius]MBA4549252.1 hypothetical protein [Thermoactinomyces intermedius]MBA4837061.1 hypothetical protein [Thermoactinomyces intermedius]MBH8595732.1 hypothetical protein [Thermoactinomyces intermedius]
MSVNRWMIYDWMKYRYMKTGVKPTRDEVLNQFQGADFEEIAEGIAEFNLVVDRLPGGMENGSSTESTAS